MGASVPYDFESCLALGDWRRDLAWPVGSDELDQLYRRMLRGGLDLLGRCDGGVRIEVLAAIGQVANVAMAAAEAALCVQREPDSGLHVVASAPEFAYLRGQEVALPSRVSATVSAPRFPARRHIEVMRKWTPWYRLLSALLSAQAVAISESELLVHEAAREPRPVAFRHCGLILLQARRRVGTSAAHSRHDVAQQLTSAFAGCVPLHEPLAARYRAVVLRAANEALGKAATDLAGLALIHMPSEVWAGAGGAYASRVVGLEARRRGGKVVRFDHGGTVGMTSHPESAAVVELSTATRYVMPSQPLATNVADALELLPIDLRPQLAAGSGDPTFGAAPPPRPPLRGRKRRVVYCPSLLFGFRRHAVATVPDAIELDWNLRVAETLVALPIDLVCKPHPEGILKGHRHPIEAIATTSYRRLEDEIADTDLFVFDRANSTAFWIALCTDRPVVFIRHAPPDFHPNVRAVIEQRCRVLHAEYDSANRPILDRDALTDAVMNAPSQCDPSALRRLLAPADPRTAA